MDSLLNKLLELDGNGYKAYNNLWPMPNNKAWILLTPTRSAIWLLELATAINRIREGQWHY